MAPKGWYSSMDGWHTASEVKVAPSHLRAGDIIHTPDLAIVCDVKDSGLLIRHIGSRKFTCVPAEEAIGFKVVGHMDDVYVPSDELRMHLDAPFQSGSKPNDAYLYQKARQQIDAHVVKEDRLVHVSMFPKRIEEAIAHDPGASHWYVVVPWDVQVQLMFPDRAKAADFSPMLNRIHPALKVMGYDQTSISFRFDLASPVAP